ncbi:MAG: formylglycine-generating enzyme family protein [Kiritimatiellae bacterium]|nr:formylglycine-generating enzyme family protein [Kiritimatiellia bacterium]
MKKSVLSILAASAAFTLIAAPVVRENSVTMSQSGGVVTIGYTLEGDAGIVTVDIQTNGVSIGSENLSFMAGDVNKVVQPGARTITWKPYKAWPDNSAASARAVVSAWATDAPPDYMVVSLAADNSVRYFATAEEVPFGVTDDRYKTEYLLLRKVPAANVEWRMGSPSTERWRESSREVPRLVTLSDDYYIGVYEVTQKQYAMIYGSNPSTYTADGDMKPVEKCWFDHLRGAAGSGYDWPNNGHAVSSDSFFGKLRAKSGVTGFDLPTEAQWEFACRAGCGAGLYSGKEDIGWDTDANVAELAVNGYGSLTSTDTVGLKLANAWGLYDMLGNVQEWVLDWLTDAPDGGTDPTGPASGSHRILRGGHYGSKAQDCRCASRSFMVPNWSTSEIGFRVACSIPIQQ